jgi:hypothetical protein
VHNITIEPGKPLLANYNDDNNAGPNAVWPFSLIKLNFWIRFSLEVWIFWDNNFEAAS